MELDENLAAMGVSECRNLLKDIPTRTKLTICYNLTTGVFRLFSILGDKKWVMGLIDEFHEGLKKEINEMYEVEE